MNTANEHRPCFYDEAVVFLSSAPEHTDKFNVELRGVLRLFMIGIQTELAAEILLLRGKFTREKIVPEYGNFCNRRFD